MVYNRVFRQNNICMRRSIKRTEQCVLGYRVGGESKWVAASGWTLIHIQSVFSEYVTFFGLWIYKKNIRHTLPEKQIIIANTIGKNNNNNNNNNVVL